MSSYDYHFVTRWRFRTTPEQIDAILSDVPSVAQWWPQLYKDVRILARGNDLGIGKVVDVVTKGFLPYVIHWQYRVTNVEPGKGFGIEATGDLIGRGQWTFEKDGEYTNVTYDWQVTANKPLLKTFSFLRPLFVWNHHYVMKKGERGMERELQRRRP